MEGRHHCVDARARSVPSQAYLGAHFAFALCKHTLLARYQRHIWHWPLQGKAAANGHAMMRVDSPQPDAPEQEAERALGWESGSADAADGAAAQSGAETAAGSGAGAAAAKAAAAQGDGPGASTERGPGRRRTPETLNPEPARRRPSTEELENEVELGFDEEGPAGANEEAALEQKAAVASHRQVACRARQNENAKWHVKEHRAENVAKVCRNASAAKLLLADRAL